MKIALRSCKPIGNMVLIKIDRELESRAGNIALPDGVEIEHTAGCRIGKIVAMGDLAQQNEVKEHGPEVKVGERVLFIQRGIALLVDGEDHELLPGAQVLAVVVPQAEDNLAPAPAIKRTLTYVPADARG